jgi:hypothetical protein
MYMYLKFGKLGGYIIIIIIIILVVVEIYKNKWIEISEDEYKNIKKKLKFNV